MRIRSAIAGALVQLAAAAVLAVLAGCGGGGGGASGTPPADGGAIAPQIVSQPQSLSLVPGDTATFSVGATGSNPLTYQWRRNNVAIVGANATSYTTAALTSTDNGSQYDVIVSNSAGSVTSATAALTVRSAGAAGARLSIGSGHALAVRADGSVIAWGTNNLGQLGGGPAIAGTVARAVSVSAIAVAAGKWESLALRADGVVQGWGTKFADLTIIGGDAASAGTLVPSPVGSAFPSGVTAIVTGTANSFSFALLNDGTVWHLPGGRMAIAGGATSSPRQVAGLTNVKSLASGAGGTGKVVAIRTDGSIWEINVLGGVGGDWVATAAAVAGLPAVASASCGPDHCLAVAADGSVWGWGTNIYGMLGSGNPTSPVHIAGLADVIAVAATPDSSLAITADHRLWSWGSAARSGLPGLTSNAVPAPTVVPGLTGVLEVSGGLQSVLVRLDDYTVWGFGDNTFGELGTGTAGASQTPVRATGITLN